MTKFHIKAYIPRILFLFAALLFFTSPSQAETREFTYQVYAGGIHAVEAKLFFDTGEKSYDISLDAKTRGWLASLVPWEGKFATTGNVKNASFIPNTHKSVSVWRGETETKTFGYKNTDLTSVIIEEDNKPTVNVPIEQELTANTTDILSATLGVMDHVIKSSECSGTSDIYDGKRRFTLLFQDKGQSELRKSKYNIFSGPARFCTVEIEPKGGRWHDKPRGWLSIQEQGRQKGALPAVWMAKVDGFEYAIPVKIRVKTDYGTLMMHLTNVK